MQKSINGSFDFLGVPETLRTNRTYWIDNISVSIPAWGVSGTVKNLNWGSQPGSHYDNVSVPWCGAVPACSDYLPRSPENTRSTARRIRDDILRENLLTRVQSISIPARFSVIVWSIICIAPGMIFGMSQLKINLCG